MMEVNEWVRRNDGLFGEMIRIVRTTSLMKTTKIFFDCDH
jgi:hypothetical protein